MNIWSKVFLGIIIAVALAVVSLAALEMRIRSTGQKRVLDLTDSIRKAEEGIANINAGTAPTKSRLDKTAAEWSFEELRNVVTEQYQERGRAWFGCRVEEEPVEKTLPPALQQVSAQVTITGPLVPGEAGAETAVAMPEQLRGVVYVFQEEDKGEQEGDTGKPQVFLGRFTVDSAPTSVRFLDDEGNEKNGYKVTLITADPVSASDIERIKGAAGAGPRWAIYLKPPMDRIAGIFDRLTEEEKEMIPEELRERLGPRPMPALTDEEKDGVDPKVLAILEQIRTTIDNPEAETARDFALALDWLYMRQSEIRRNIKNTESDMVTFVSAEAIRKAENEKLTADGDLEIKRSAAMDAQRDAVKALLEQYQGEVDKIKLLIEKLQANNEGLVGKMAEAQAKAAEIMEAREANAAQGDGAVSE